MLRYFTSSALLLALASWASSAAASERVFVYTHESRVLPPGETDLAWWSTFRLGRERYFNRLDGRLGVERGLSEGLELALYWSFDSQTRDEVQSSLTGELQRVSTSELAGASLELAYQLSDASADSLGSALRLLTTLGTSRSELGLRLTADRALGQWLLAANLGSNLRLRSLRTTDGTEVDSAFELEPTLAAGYRLPRGFALALELRASIGLSGDGKSTTLFGGPVASWAERGHWLALGVQPQLAALSGRSPGRRLDLTSHERLEVRLLAGFSL